MPALLSAQQILRRCTLHLLHQSFMTAWTLTTNSLQDMVIRVKRHLQL